MICPKCNTEYREGFSKCSDCGVDLMNKVENGQSSQKITQQGINIIKYGMNLLFITFLEIIAVVIIYEFYWVYRLSNGGVTGSAFANIHSIVWCIVILQIIISIGIMAWGNGSKIQVKGKTWVN